MSVAIFMLRILAVLIGALFLIIIALRTSGIDIGLRISGNSFTDKLGGVKVYVWLLGAIAVAEVMTVLLLVFISGK